jgi:DNA invertase Pin-like site-specific DNA recombinase
MMNGEPNKIRVEHLQRDAYLYVRQSSVRQVYEHTESTKRQYALAERAVALGWPRERIITIDSDLGQSGSSAVNRDGFKKLVAEVGMGHAGIVIGIEVSRLARNSSDWHRLLEICALTETLILDEDGVYDPNAFNDRLVLGLKGTMSEAELHYLKARMWGGRLAKAKRGELRTPLPVGFVYGEDGKVILDPDHHVQQVIRTFFEVFRQKRSARAVVIHLQEKHIQFPSVLLKGPRKGEIVWGRLLYTRGIQILHNPRYAGIFSYGKLKTRRTAEGTMKYLHMPRQNWHAFIRDAHASYISYEEWEQNQHILAQNAQSYRAGKPKGPPREGSALLQGIILCGKCGRRMHVHYRSRSQKIEGDYRCEQYARNRGLAPCQRVNGRVIDAAVSELLLQSFTPLAVDLAFQIQDELKQRYEALDSIRRQHLQRLEYEANMARRRYMQVDPENRLVADTLEAEWNNKLRAVKDAHKEYEKQSETDRSVINEKEKKEIIALATDFPLLWNNPKTSHQDKKRIVRYLIDDVTVAKTTDRSILVQVRFKGGATKTLGVLAPKPATELFRTSREIIDRIDTLLNTYHDSRVADVLNSEGYRTPRGKEFRNATVGYIRRTYGLKSFYDRFHEQKKYTIKEIAKKLGVSYNTVYLWVKNETIKTWLHTERKFYICELNPENLKERLTSEYRAGRTSKHFYSKIMNRLNEVQYEF